jgi:tagatose-6-phosphate ketose/aldose isomerase
MACGKVDELSVNANELFNKYLPQIVKVASSCFERVIFLGSGPLLGIARECHLKLQELTDGKVICKHDSFLGFRHGPRAVINKSSLIVYLFSADPRVFKYETDLVQSIAKDSPDVPTISCGRKIAGLKNDILSIEFSKSSNEGGLGFILPAILGQLIGFFQCLRLGLQPDNPSVSGSINRVVQGVTIYR